MATVGWSLVLLQDFAVKQNGINNLFHYSFSIICVYVGLGLYYRKTSNIRRTLVSNEIADNSY